MSKKNTPSEGSNSVKPLPIEGDSVTIYFKEPTDPDPRIREVTVRYWGKTYGSFPSKGRAPPSFYEWKTAKFWINADPMGAGWKPLLDTINGWGGSHMSVIKKPDRKEKEQRAKIRGDLKNIDMEEHR